MADRALIGADIHDGNRLHSGKALVLDGPKVVGIFELADVAGSCPKTHLDGGIILPGFVDLQVNGGGGVMFNDDQSVDVLATIAKAHARVGTAAFLPTLITDTASRTLAAIDAVALAIEKRIPGIIGIHLEGPHLSVARKGAHDPALIRKMEDQDLQIILSAAGRLPNVMATVAPENVTPDQIATLAAGGVVVSLGHTGADYQTCIAAFKKGARCTTHLFNAMSQLGNREPGLVGATLDSDAVAAGLIADGIHVHPATIRAALAAKRGPQGLFLVTDAMASVGSDISEFELNGRRIFRREGKLTLSDGTLAGADLDMPGALRIMTGKVGLSLEQAIKMATSNPAGVLRADLGFGLISNGQTANLVYMDSHLSIAELRFS